MARWDRVDEFIKKKRLISQYELAGKYDIFYEQMQAEI